ncbi:hypothetical protein PanWU01x14_209450 [Parasponia andersonii]|uniref:Uncharacterized protein n=1 Tax=Parasponia andersonii TaxID=3476 RepID=A0A2P5BUG2_PARAD|nr:hypothetical protein PanWU01x14_209450 [Parasponia andersonii]
MEHLAPASASDRDKRGTCPRLAGNVAEKGVERGPLNVAMSDQSGRLGTHDRVPGGTGRVAECCGRGAPACGMRAHHRGTTGRGAQDACATRPHCAQHRQTC